MCHSLLNRPVPYLARFYAELVQEDLVTTEPRGQLIVEAASVCFRVITSIVDDHWRVSGSAPIDGPPGDDVARNQDAAEILPGVECVLKEPATWFNLLALIDVVPIDATQRVVVFVPHKFCAPVPRHFDDRVAALERVTGSF
jgi:hypothetical protein